MTKNTKILIAVVVIILIVIFWKQISSLWNGSSDERNASSEKGQSCDAIQAQIKVIEGQLKALGCGVSIPSNDPKCSALISQKGLLQASLKQNNCNKPILVPVENPPTQFPVQCDPKHYGYDKNGHPRTECGYKYPTPQPPVPVQPTCGQLLEQISMMKKKILTAPNPQQLAYLQQYIKGLELKYGSMDCGGGPKPTSGQ